jgi:chemotaxis protein methyltransferase CheR
MPTLPMAPQVFSILSALVAERAGLHFDASHAPIFGDKVAARAMEIGFDSLLEYYYFLRYDAGGGAELDLLVEQLVVGETYLFRELPPLEVAINRFVLPAIEQGRRPRIWCAACATGEEPHTVALILAARGLLNQVDLVASDISNAALRRARAGRFGRRALRGEVPAFAARWIHTDPEGVSVEAQLTDAVQWQRINLIDGARWPEMGLFDVILCRNVLIYFSDDTARRVVANLNQRLRPGGVLVVGISESLLRFGSDLRCEERDGVFLYEKLA